MTGLSVDANIDASVDLFGKTVNDLQTNITVKGKSVAGTLKYVADYSSAYGSGEDSGNYLVLHAEVPDVDDVTITAQVINGVHGTSTLDDDGILISRISDKSSQKIKFVASKEGYKSVSKTYDLSGLVCLSE